MNKSALKTFATNARRELLKKIEAKAMKIGITEDNIKKADIESSDAIFIDGRQLSKEEKNQRNRLIDRIKQIGFKQVMEEVAYTWFNRFTALRFMEVNDYLPTKIRVLSSTNIGSSEPDMMKEALSLDLDLDKEYIYELKINNNSEELFKYLLIKHCNDLNRYMPFMFETIDDYTEILFPEGLLATDSFIRQMTNTEVIPEDNWRKIEVIGWLYQFYIAEEKDQVFANLKKNIKITKDTLPAATQLFTPNWIVRYMVENSLGSIWLESYPESHLKSEWKYYLDNSQQEESVIKQLKEISYKDINLEEVTFLDPCCGSGHILVYAFDVFYDMYLEKGYTETEIPQLIIEKNLYGLDVDNRAAQLASFAVMMKAREKSRRIFRKSIQPNIFSLQESKWLTDEIITNISGNDNKIRDNLIYIRDVFLDAKEYGSLLHVDQFEYELLERRLHEYEEEESDLVEMIHKQKVEERLPNLLKQALILSNKFDVVCTNPPYMGRSGMSAKLSDYLKKNYKDSKSDLFAAFIERGFNLTTNTGFNSMVTMQSWMFLSSYEKMRKGIINNKTITSLLHMDNMVMGIAFGTAATVMRNINVSRFKGNYNEVKYKDINNNNEPNSFPIKQNRNSFVSSENFNKISGSPIAYWASEEMLLSFENGTPLGEIAYPRQGMATTNNNRFLRQWYEVSNKKIGFSLNSEEETIGEYKWFPYNKGGEFRKWYGNNDYVVNFQNKGKEVCDYIDSHSAVDHKGRVINRDKYFKECITWSKVSSGNIAFRFKPNGFIFDVAGTSIFGNKENLRWLMAVLNSNVVLSILKCLSPTLNFEVGHISSIPIIFNEGYNDQIQKISEQNISISKKDWDSFEISWEFRKHPLLNYSSSDIKSAFDNWKESSEEQFNQIKANEEKINDIFIEIYNLKDELESKVEDKDVTVRRADLARDIKSFISYAIGCSFGRYSLDEEGLIYAGGEFEPNRYKAYAVNQDNILPILPGSYFDDDIVSRFVDFVRVTFGEESITENLNFIADALDRKKGETAKETLRRYFLNDFYNDHVKTYSKRPIYWLFTSGKEGAFNCLIYMHRYDKTTLSRIRTDYLHDYQIRLDAEKNDLLNIIEGDYTAKEISNAKKELKSLDKKIEELKAYDELLHHMADMQIEIDLDDGVKANYEKFKGLVAKI